MSPEKKNDFENRPNTKVQYRTPEEMQRYLRELITMGFSLIEVSIVPKVIAQPGKFPYDIKCRGARAGPYFEKLIHLLTNVNAQVLMVGFLEKLETLMKLEKDEKMYTKLQEMEKEYNKFLVDVSVNIATLQRELGI